METKLFSALAGVSRGADFGPEVDVTAAIRELQEAGFKPAYVSDLKVGDIWAKEPERFPYHDYVRMIHVVERIDKLDASYVEEDDSFVRNVVVNMICYSDDGLSRHMSYSSSHGVYIFNG